MDGETNIPAKGEPEARPPRKPRLGDRVHFVMDRGRNVGACRAADIVRVWTKNGPWNGAVQLTVHTDHTNDFADSTHHGANGVYWATSVQQKTDGTAYSYHYPYECPNGE